MHRKPRSVLLRLFVALGAAIASMLLALTFAGGSSAAAAGDSVDATNSHVLAQCALNTKTVTSTGDTLYFLTSQGYPSNLAGYALNVYTETDCTVLDGNTATVLATYNRSTNSSWLPQLRESVSLPASDHYVVCAQGKVKLAQPGPDGLKESWTPVVCSS